MSQTRYEVLGKIAEGGLGAVYKAYDRNLRREVALKRVRAATPEEADQQAEQLFTEARTLSTLQHPHIVTIFDVGRDEEGAFIVMELLKGETLEDIIERGALNQNDFQDLAIQSLEGMISAHSTGLIHLDIKPQNFMVIWLPSGKFQIKILDFGLSQISHQPLIQETDEDGSIMGSIFFMAPEQFERSPVDVRTDLYSLGCVYYFALTQNYPFQGETAPEVMSSHLYHSFIPLAQLRPDLPKFIPQWVEWLMSRDPNHRPENVSHAFQIFSEGQFPPAASAAPLPDYIPPPNFVATDSVPTLFPSPHGGSSSQMLRPGAPRRPKPTATQALGAKKMPKPKAKPINIAAASAPKHLQQTKSLPLWLTRGLPIALAAILILFFATRYILSSQARSRFDELVKMDQPVGTPKDIPLLFRFLEDPATTEAAGKVLGKLQNVDVSNPQIIAHLGKTQTPHAAQHLTTAVAQRELKDSVPALLNQLKTSTHPGTRLATWQALGRFATFEQLPELLNQLSSESPEELRAAENALVRTARTQTDLSQRSQPLLQTLRANTLKPDQQAAVIRALGQLGSNDALPDLLKALTSPDSKLRTAAALGLGHWSTSTPILNLLDFIREEKNPFIRGNAIDSIGNLAPLAGNLPQEEIAAALITAHAATKDNREQTSILDALSKVVSPVSMEFFQKLAAEVPRRRVVADRAMKLLSDAQAKATVITAEPTILAPEKAELTPGPLILKTGSIINWFGTNDLVTWLFKLDTPGTYEIQLSQASDSREPGRYLVTFGTERFSKAVEPTGNASTFRSVTVGSAKFEKPGYYRLWIRPQQIPKGQTLMRLREATITRVGD
jgi:serine/threonine protein kinase/HEAT repeat protein